MFSFSALCMILLEILPLPLWLDWLRPMWFMLWILFGLIAGNMYLNLWTIWLMGLLLDILVGGLIGVHALTGILLWEFFQKIRQRFLLFPLLQQTITVLFMAFAVKFIEFLAQLFWLSDILPSYYWLSVLTTASLWPWFYLILFGFSVE